MTPDDVESGPLTNFTMDELWEELSSRCEYSVFTFCKPVKVGDTRGHEVWYRNGWAPALGLAQYSVHVLSHKPSDDEDEEEPR